MAEQPRLEPDFRVRQYLGPYVNRSERKSRSRESCRRYLATFGATANPGIEHQVAGWLVVELQVSRPLGIGDVPMHGLAGGGKAVTGAQGDRKSRRLNSSHLVISYAVFCLKKKM